MMEQLNYSPQTNDGNHGMHQNAAIKKSSPVHIVYGEPQWTKVVRLKRKHTLYMYKVMHAAHSALSYNVSYSISLFLSTVVLHALLCLLLHTRHIQ